ncbi:MAG: hypothetical protein K0R63_1761 [Rickettsiales bacterium]|jgi:hypothetical protein|nr:hypothetical protein [Rickettsiales bacterium]
MSLVAHLQTLHHKHSLLKAQIEEAYSHHLPDFTLVDLKKQKLRLKEEIVRLEAMQYEERAAASLRKQAA